MSFGSTDDTPQPADYDGDTDLATFTGTTGYWWFDQFQAIDWTWDGRDATGALALDGTYTVQVSASDLASVTSAMAVHSSVVEP